MNLSMTGLAVLLALPLTGCATFKHMFDQNRGTLEAANKVDNPKVSGEANPHVLGHEGEISEVRMKSYDAPSGRLCFSARTPNPKALEDVKLVTYRSLEDYDAVKHVKEAATSVKVVGTGKAQHSYDTTEKVTHKDSSGRVYATSEAPVTKTESVRYSDLEICFPAKILAKDSRYMALQVSAAGLTGPSDLFIAAWQL